MTTLTEPLHPGAFIVSEQEAYMSRETVTFDQNQTIAAGQVIGRTVVPASAVVAATAGSANTGNGVLTVANPGVDTAASPGTYRVTFTDPTHFLVEDPDGRTVGEGVVGAAFARGVKFTIAAGATAFAAGDGFAVSASFDGAGELWVAHNPVATDGSQVARAIAVYPVVTGAGVTQKGAALVRLAQVRLSDLTLAAGITAAQTVQLRKDLRDRNIIFR